MFDISLQYSESDVLRIEDDIDVEEINTILMTESQIHDVFKDGMNNNELKSFLTESVLVRNRTNTPFVTATLLDNDESLSMVDVQVDSRNIEISLESAEIIKFDTGGTGKQGVEIELQRSEENENKWGIVSISNCWRNAA